MTIIEQAESAAAASDAASPTDHESAVDAFADRMLQSALATTDLFAAYLGDRLGWYRDLAAHGASTAAELAERTGTSSRYAREWLEQQAVSGVLRLEGRADGTAAARRFRLPVAAAEVLTDATSLAFLGPLPRLFAAVGPQLPALLNAYRTGGGVSWAQLGEDAREAQADLNRPWFGRLPEALVAVPTIDAVLREPRARIADVGTGEGWSAIALARAYPLLCVEGFDVDAPSIAAARQHARAAGVDDRVFFHLADGAELAEHGDFDAVFAFECLHDMPQPVEVLTAMREAVRPGGPVVIMDEAVAEELQAPGTEVERLMYGFSLLVCLPDGLAHPSSVGTGTVMRPSVLRRYAREAGFAGVDVLPIEDFGFFRFYSLTR
ncbi:Methyltransferase domain-containing protein [Agrococcus baldri]|uniref:Methyltransferase domain-containing protein n=1 Tax=Agrococcus baldri TaxID=153730 RepID=A0AA94L0Z5_9MICO|nr:class I SAM-dependent methyltransferase [Agrococcus baldri]SFS18896.1 Methyltransferase domain-containing protein [Agrococcus baldri]